MHFHDKNFQLNFRAMTVTTTNEQQQCIFFSTSKSMHTILKFTDRLNGIRIIFTILTMEIAMNFITDKCLFFIIFIWFFCVEKPRYAMLDHSLNIISEPETKKLKQRIFHAKTEYIPSNICVKLFTRSGVTEYSISGDEWTFFFEFLDENWF